MRTAAAGGPAEASINDNAPKADSRLVAFLRKRPLSAVLVAVAAFTVLATSPAWLPRGAEWVVLALLALVWLVGETVRWRRRRHAKRETSGGTA